MNRLRIEWEPSSLISGNDPCFYMSDDPPKKGSLQGGFWITPEGDSKNPTVVGASVNEVNGDPSSLSFILELSIYPF